MLLKVYNQKKVSLWCIKVHVEVQGLIVRKNVMF